MQYSLYLLQSCLLFQLLNILRTNLLLRALNEFGTNRHIFICVIPFRNLGLFQKTKPPSKNIIGPRRRGCQQVFANRLAVDCATGYIVAEFIALQYHFQRPLLPIAGMQILVRIVLLVEKVAEIEHAQRQERFLDIGRSLS